MCSWEFLLQTLFESVCFKQSAQTLGTLVCKTVIILRGERGVYIVGMLSVGIWGGLKLKGEHSVKGCGGKPSGYTIPVDDPVKGEQMGVVPPVYILSDNAEIVVKVSCGKVA